MAEKKTIPEVMGKEDLVLEKVDEHGERWVKKYVGGGSHFFNWL